MTRDVYSVLMYVKFVVWGGNISALLACIMARLFELISIVSATLYVRYSI
jgi:hypothetical protein